MEDFYFETVRTLIDDGTIARDSSVLICCGGALDREVFLRAGFSDVVVSNLDVRMQGSEDEYAPFRWSFQDAEALQFEDNSFDLVVAHSGLHHCRSPHRGLLEMYRVARKGVLVFEPKDGLLTRLGARLGVGQDYEHAAVVGNSLKYGGVANTEVPNFVYRWSRGDVEKTIHSYAPHARHRFRYFYALRIPWGRLEGLRNPFWKTAVRLVRPAVTLASRMPFLANNVAFWVSKPRIPEDLQPWMAATATGELKVNPEWLRQSYDDRFFGNSGS